MKYVLITAVTSLLFFAGCKSQCSCGCPYCCGGSSTDYSNPTNKPAPDIPIWWDKEENK